jgi:hypothetical protein
MWKSFVYQCKQLFCCTKEPEIDNIVHLTHMQTKFNTDVEPTTKNPRPVSMSNPIRQYPSRHLIEGHVVIDDNIINISEYDVVSRSEITDENSNNTVKYVTNNSTIDSTIDESYKEKKTMNLSNKNPFKDDINFDFNNI